MRALIYIFLIFSFRNVFADCEDLVTAEKLLDPVNFKNAYKESHAKNGSEPILHLQDYQQARSYVINQPMFEHLGFGKVSANSLSGWHPYKSRMGKSKSNGMIVGWEKKLPSGASARIRVDYAVYDLNNPKAGGMAHINVEFFKIPEFGEKETYKLAVAFKCPGKANCTEEDIMKIVKNLSH